MKVTKTNGVSYGVKYEITAADTGSAAVAEVLQLVVTSEATADGDVDIVLRGAAPVSIAVLDTDDTAAKVATKIRAGTFTGWTTSGSDATVIFTADDEEAKSGVNTFEPNDTGVEATDGITVTTLGADAVAAGVLFDFGRQSYRYELVANVNILNSNVVTNPVDLAITYPANGQVQVSGTLVAGRVIQLVAQRDSLA